jgi:endo-1,4-beta-xylanase
MKIKRRSFLETSFLASASLAVPAHLQWIASAQEANTVAQAATALLEKDAALHGELRVTANGSAQMEMIDVAGQPFTKAVRIQTLKQASFSRYVFFVPAVEIAFPAHGAVEHGDALLATFWIRFVEQKNPSIDHPFCVRMGGVAGYEELGIAVVGGSEWRKVQYPFRAISKFARQRSGQATDANRPVELIFVPGSGLQAVEIGGIELENFGKTRRVRELPITSLGYSGREPDAAWRQAAEARIEQIRKGDLTIVVKDRSGRPIRNAAVAVKMRRHAFGFGTAVNGPTMTGKAWPDDREKYKQAILQLFNKAVVENDLKWSGWENEANRPATFEFIDWMLNAGLTVRGHNLVWPSWEKSPPRLRQLQNDPQALAKTILDHIAEETTALRGRLVEWDVINEPFYNHAIIELLGDDSMVDWFNAAHRGDPGPKLFINDYDILGANDAEHRDYYAKTIQYLIDRGAPIAGIGMQGHFSAQVTPPEELLRRIDRFAKLNKSLQVTEFDIATNDELLQADYTRDLLTVVFSHPAFIGFMMWGFWEPNHWRPQGAMIQDDWTTKPNYDAYMDLVFKKWWTNASGKTGPQGMFNVRGFVGEYDVEVSVGRRTRTLKVSLPSGGTTVECNLDAMA